MVSKKINSQILAIWKNWKQYFPHTDPELGPLFFHNFKKNCILFIGLNPSEPKRLNKIDKWKLRTPKEEMSWINQCVEADEWFLEKHPYFQKFRELSKEIHLEWEHIDLFFYKETSQKKFSGMIYKKRELTKFANDQLEVSLKLIESINPKVIVVANALASKIIKGSLGNKITFNDLKGFHIIRINKRVVPIFFSSMWTGQRALDTGSLERLKWHIKQSIR